MRAALRLNSDYMLRNVEVVSEAADGDLLGGLIFTAIMQANVRPISNDPKLGKTYGQLDTIPPDEMRWPVSVNALAESLKIPYETTRRHVNKLIKDGWCVKVANKGVIIPATVVGSPAMIQAAFRSFSHLQHFIGQLREIGFLDS